LFCGFVMVVVSVLLAVDGGISLAPALDRWAGTAVLGGIPVGFIVLVNPGIGASWEWRFGGVQLGSGFLAASVSRSTVNGTLFTTGGAIFEPGVCCRPCNFTGSIAGNRVDGTFDAVSCDGSGTFVLVKQ
jgi:hypothetical protein